MPENKEVEPTTADEQKEPSSELTDIYKSLNDGKEPPDSNPPTALAAGPEDEPEDETLKDAGDKAKEEESEEEDEDLTLTDDDLDPVDERIEAALKDIPEDKRGGIEKLLKEQKKGVEKIVAQTQEAKERYTSWEAPLSNKATAPQAFAHLASAVEQATGITREELISALGGNQSSVSKPELDPRNMDKWQEFKDQKGEQLYASPREMDLAVQLEQVRQAQLKRDQDVEKFLKEQKDKESASKATEDTERWLTGNVPKIKNEVAIRLNGWEVTKDMIRQALEGKRPTKLSEAVSLIKSRFADEYIAHQLDANKAPVKKREITPTNGVKGRHIDIPSDPENYSAEHAYKELQAQGKL